jgi:hypothetical protein
MYPGAIVSFQTDNHIQYGQVLHADIDEIQLKQLFCDKMLVIHHWMKSAADGTLRMAFDHKKNVIELCKTLVYIEPIAIMEIPTKSRLKLWWQRMRGMKYCAYWYSTGIVWRLKRRLHGTLFADGWFIPFGKHKAIYFTQYNRLKKWQEMIFKPL